MPPRRSRLQKKNNEDKLLRDVLPRDIIKMTRSYYNTTAEGKKIRIEKARNNLYFFVKERLERFWEKYFETNDFFSRGFLYAHYKNISKKNNYHPIVFAGKEEVKDEIINILKQAYDINQIANEIIDRYYRYLGTDDPYEFLKINLWTIYYMNFSEFPSAMLGGNIDDFVDYSDNCKRMLMIFLMNSDDLENNKCQLITYLYSQYPELFKTPLKFNENLYIVERRHLKRLIYDNELKKYIYEQIINSGIPNLKLKHINNLENLDKIIKEFHKKYASRGICLNNEPLLRSNVHDFDSDDYRDNLYGYDEEDEDEEDEDEEDEDEEDENDYDEDEEDEDGEDDKDDGDEDSDDYNGDEDDEV